jgi:hypothetical protein
MLLRFSLLFSSIISIPALGAPVDCDKIPPFKPMGYQSVSLMTYRSHWMGQDLKEESICERSGNVEVFDVRGRENEAFWCLKSQKFDCETVVNSKQSVLYVVPAIWVRNGNPAPRREYRFHATVVPSDKPNAAVDVFTRYQTESVHESQTVYLEGRLTNFFEVPESDGIVIQAKFGKVREDLKD